MYVCRYEGRAPSGPCTASITVYHCLFKTVIHALQSRDPASRVHFCSWFLQSLVEGDIDPQLAFFSDEEWFHFQGYINKQNNRYWSSQNPHLSHEVPLHPVTFGVWGALSARSVGPVF
jgi:hypothetical protein